MGTRKVWVMSEIDDAQAQEGLEYPVVESGIEGFPRARSANWNTLNDLN